MIKTRYAALLMVLIMIIAALPGCGSADQGQSGGAGQEPAGLPTAVDMPAGAALPGLSPECAALPPACRLPVWALERVRPIG